MDKVIVVKEDGIEKFLSSYQTTRCGGPAIQTTLDRMDAKTFDESSAEFAVITLKGEGYEVRVEDV